MKKYRHFDEEFKRDLIARIESGALPAMMFLPLWGKYENPPENAFLGSRFHEWGQTNLREVQSLFKMSAEKVFKPIMRQIVGLCGFPIYRRLLKPPFSNPPNAFRILSLHDVPRAQQPLLDRLVKFIHDECGVITPDEAMARLDATTASTAQDTIPFLFTFDDGFKSHATVVLEVLEKYGIKAIFFICPSLMDLDQAAHREVIAKNIFDNGLDAAEIPDEMRLMSWSDAELLMRSGHTIGAHTLSHRRLPKLAEPDMVEEIVGSGQKLEKKLGVPVKWFSFPFGDNASINALAFKVIRKHYRFCCSDIRGLNTEATDPMLLLRGGVNLNHPFHYQRMLMLGGLDFLFKKKALELENTARCK